MNETSSYSVFGYQGRTLAMVAGPFESRTLADATRVTLRQEHPYYTFQVEEFRQCGDTSHGSAYAA